MKRKITILLFLFSLIASRELLWARLDAGEYYKPLIPGEAHSKMNNEIVKQLQRRHFRRFPFDDHLSSKVFDGYISSLDHAKSYFLQSDIGEFEPFRYQLDDALKSGSLERAFKIYNRYHQRAIERLVFVINRLEQGLPNIRFDVEETLSVDRENASWPANPGEMDELWRKRLKASVLSLKLTDKPLKEIIELLTKRYRSQLNRTVQTTSEDVFQIYINSLAQIYDPHTYYFSPRATENFNINMSLSLEGIGAVLQTENEYTKVIRLVPAGPADKAKELKPGDRIVGVGQDNDGEVVDVIGWRLDEVVDLIRGPKETVVRLRIIPTDSVDEHETKVITIVRNTVKLEEQSAQKKIIDIEHKGRTYKIGVIDIPTFYLDFQGLREGDPLYKSTTRDVKKILKELVDARVDGIVVDLRDNSGGALQEVNTLTGLFIKEGPIVQVRYANGGMNVLKDPDPEIVYSGPLAVVINRMSASASEIFAGAIQDYRRGIIIGEQTYGKGTVQTLYALSKGQLKTTMAKFYRVSGESTQHKGVIPDISYPSFYDMDEVGESALPEALPWDQIKGVSCVFFSDIEKVMARLQDGHKKRIVSDPDYTYLIESIEHLKKIREKKEIFLSEATRTKEKDEVEKWRLEIENKRRKALNLEPLDKLSDNATAMAPDRFHNSDNETDEKDHMLVESGHILLDLASFLKQE